MPKLLPDTFPSCNKHLYNRNILTIWLYTLYAYDSICILYIIQNACASRLHPKHLLDNRAPIKVKHQTLKFSGFLKGRVKEVLVFWGCLYKLWLVISVGWFYSRDLNQNLHQLIWLIKLQCFKHTSWICSINRMKYVCFFPKWKSFYSLKE